MNNIEYKVCIIGAGPAGLLTYDYLTQRNVSTVAFESSCSYGGQCTAFYRNKQINGIPGLYNTSAGEFIQNIYNQCINKNNIILNANINVMNIRDDLFYLKNNDNIYTCKYLILATGASSMKPIVPNIKGIDKFINDEDFLQFYCSDFEQYKDKKVVIAGGGDSAVDYAIEISNMSNLNNDNKSSITENKVLDMSSIATVHNSATSINQSSLQSRVPNNVVLLHRRDTLKCNQNKLKLLNKVDLKLNQNILEIRKNLVITNKEEIQTNNVIFCYGFTYNNNFLQQLSKFGLLLDNNLINIDLNSMETSLKYCYAVGDVVKYPLKKKNIISCCFEAARVANAILNKEGLC